MTYLLMHNFCPISVFGTIFAQFLFFGQSYKLALLFSLINKYRTQRKKKLLKIECHSVGRKKFLGAYN